MFNLGCRGKGAQFKIQQIIIITRWLVPFFPTAKLHGLYVYVYKYVYFIIQGEAYLPKKK